MIGCSKSFTGSQYYLRFFLSQADLHAWNSCLHARQERRTGIKISRFPSRDIAFINLDVSQLLSWRTGNFLRTYKLYRSHYRSGIFCSGDSASWLEEIYSLVAIRFQLAPCKMKLKPIELMNSNNFYYQIIQFSMIIIHSAQLFFWNYCEFPMLLCYSGVVYGCALFALYLASWL